jgi:hypothetical protein
MTIGGRSLQSDRVSVSISDIGMHWSDQCPRDRVETYKMQEKKPSRAQIHSTHKLEPWGWREGQWWPAGRTWPRQPPCHWEFPHRSCLGWWDEKWWWKMVVAEGMSAKAMVVKGLVGDCKREAQRH